jgi:hypothetical protein
MKPLFDLDNLNSIKKEEIKFECINCENIFIADRRSVKRSLGLIKSSGRNTINYCCSKCQRRYEERLSTIKSKCVNCNTPIEKKLSQIRKNNFCSMSCSATYNNKNKKTGTKRSKMEIWIEDELKKLYNFEIIFNGKETINSELDIYIPSLNLAFELNGIFHYEPIYGEEKLKNILNNDNRKIQACIEKKIELCIIDASASKKFKAERDIKYLNIINEIIKKKLIKIK